MGDSQDLTLRAVMSDGVAAVRQTLGLGANKRRTLVLTPVINS